MKRYLAITFLMATTALGTACSSKSDDVATSTEETNALSTGLTAVASGMGSSMDSGGGELAVAQKISAYDVDVDTICANTGYAYGSGSSGAPSDAPMSNTAAYAARNAYCSLRKSPDGPDTVRGALDRVKAFICAVGNVTYDGVERDVVITISTTCFSQAFVDMATQEGITSATARVTGYLDPTDIGGNSSYEKALKIDLTDLGVGMYYIQHTSTDSKFSASMLAKDNDGGEDWFMSAVFDRTDAANSVLRLEGRFNGNNDDSQGRRYVRAHVTGATVAGEFSAPSLVEFILFDVSASSGNSAIPDSITWNTMKGNATDGYQVWYGGAGSGNDAGDAAIYATDFSSDQDSACIGDGVCTGNSGLVVDGASKLGFVKSAYSANTTEYKSLTTMFADNEEFTFTALSFDAHLE